MICPKCHSKNVIKCGSDRVHCKDCGKSSYRKAAAEAALNHGTGPEPQTTVPVAELAAKDKAIQELRSEFATPVSALRSSGVRNVGFIRHQLGAFDASQ